MDAGALVHILIYLAILVLVIIGIRILIGAAGVPVPEWVWSIVGIVIGIVILLWVGGFVHAAPADGWGANVVQHFR